MQDIKQKFHISGSIAGMDSQVEVKPHQGPFVGGGTRMCRGNKANGMDYETFCQAGKHLFQRV